MRIGPAGSAEITERLQRIREEMEVPSSFAPEVLAAADEASRRVPGAVHVDRTDLEFATLDPATATDLDQAFHLERDGDDIVLRYAIADVGWFVQPGDPVDAESWRRGLTIYLPDGKAPLHPPVLSERAASLLPDGPRPAVVFTVRLAGSGEPVLDSVERALVRSRAKLAYETIGDGVLPPELAEFAARMVTADEARGATRVEAPEQEVHRDGTGAYRLEYRPRMPSEDVNAAMSLAANLAVGRALFAAHTGLFRVMDEPDAHELQRLRTTVERLGVPWPVGQSLTVFERSLDPTKPVHAAVVMAIRRAGGGAGYVPFAEGAVPWHAAVAGTYAHATAPLRRLADRYVAAAALAISAGFEVPAFAEQAFQALPAVMERADARAGRIERLVIDLVEAVVLEGSVGQVFDAVVADVDERGARIQLTDLAVVARLATDGLEPGHHLRVRLVEASPERRQVRFAAV
ncbi:MAG: RNB domain-containing ribonuclease [Ilumatobacteraceae bacterium]